MTRNSNYKVGKSREVFDYAHVIGNLPILRFTGMSMHWRSDQIHGQSFFYFVQRHEDGERMLMPLSVKLHQACTDIFVLDALIIDFKQRFVMP